MASATVSCSCSVRLLSEADLKANDYVVEEANMSDAKAIATCVCQAFHNGDCFRVPGPDGCARTSTDEVANDFKLANRKWYIVRPKSKECLSEVVAALLCVGDNATDSSLHMVAVNNDLKGRGIGTKLL